MRPSFLYGIISKLRREDKNIFNSGNLKTVDYWDPTRALAKLLGVYIAYAGKQNDSAYFNVDRDGHSNLDIRLSHGENQDISNSSIPGLNSSAQVESNSFNVVSQVNNFDYSSDELENITTKINQYHLDNSDDISLKDIHGANISAESKKDLASKLFIAKANYCRSFIHGIRHPCLWEAVIAKYALSADKDELKAFGKVLVNYYTIYSDEPIV